MYLSELYLFTGHSASTECDGDTCGKIKLEDFMNQDKIETALTCNLVSTYISSADKVLTSFIRNIIKAPSSNLQSNQYHLQILTTDEGKIRVKGILWPCFMNRINLLGVDQSINEAEEEKIKKEFLEKVDESITVTANSDILNNFLKTSSLQSQKIVSMVNEYQTHICLDLDCSKCQSTPLPSLVTMLPVTPKNPNNFDAATSLLKCFHEKLMSSTINAIENLTTIQWLNSIEEDAEVLESADDYFRQGLVKGVKLCLNPYFFGWLEK